MITDGGMRIGGEICKAFASGADAVMVGSAFARAVEAPGRGYHWGMATSHANLPRGTRTALVVDASVLAKAPDQEEGSRMPQILALVIGGIIVVVGAVMLMIRPRKRDRTTQT